MTATAERLPATMRAQVLLRAGTVEVQQRPVPVPDPDQALVRIESVGVCGSDVHYYQHGRIGDFVVEEPMVLGHEAAGTIVAQVARAYGATEVVVTDPVEARRRTALELVASGEVDLDVLATDHYGLDDAETPLCQKPAPTTLTSMVHPGR